MAGEARPLTAVDASGEPLEALDLVVVDALFFQLVVNAHCLVLRSGVYLLRGFALFWVYRRGFKNLDGHC